jgi:hypothetical protein
VALTIPPSGPGAAFARGLIHRVAVVDDANAAGLATSLRGGVSPAWQAIPGCESVPCRVIPKPAKVTDQDGKKAVTREWHVMFGGPIFDASGGRVALGLNRQLVYADRDGLTHLLRPRSLAKDAHGMGHHRNVTCDEFATEYLG